MMTLLTSKLLWSIAGPLIAAVLIYMKGRRDESNKQAIEDFKQRQAMREAILEAERKNQELEGERDEAVYDVYRTDDIDELERLWNEKLWGKGSSKSPEKGED